MPTPPAERCAAHPGRPAVDHCPTCDRPRCGADQLPTGCTLCAPEAPTGPVRRSAGDLERLVRASLGAFAASLASATVASEYIGSPWLQYFAPAVLGVLCAGAAGLACGGPVTRALARRVQLVSAVYALLGEAFAVVLDTTYDVWSPRIEVLAPYLVAAVAAWFWAAPPKRRA